MQAQYDVVVVGAGIAGAGVAADLSRDHRVVLLEQEPQPAMHATGRSAALFSEIYGNACIRALSQASRGFFLDRDEEPAFVTPRGCIHIARQDELAGIEALASEPSVAPFVTALNGDEVRALVPVLFPGVVVAALSENHSYDLDVDAIHQHFLRQMRGNGGVLHCSSPVTRCMHDGRAWTVHAGDRVLRAPIVINAAGAWGDVLAKMAGAQPVGLQPKRRTAVIVDPPQGVDSAKWPAVIHIGEKFYFKPEAGKILMSPADETPVDPHDAYPDELDVAIAVDRVQQVADIAVRRVEHSWAGLRTFAPDKTPVVGYDSRVPGFFWLTGQGGYGIQTAPALSELAASLVRRRGIPDALAAAGVTQAELAPARFQAPGGASSQPETSYEPINGQASR
ncbi:FAD-binding oxidoreductase [Novosphingobium sp. 1949]|uniref:FAD-binding oxidoreductase n=1 Tax=Novosphingobium organovorum TaxID=2930092 RepID=A0ABT0BGZ0_9SPHN|nr:FAD-binding oxidoreductase [Novosphingobium organovorum]MCJ2184098.1 FAD-binding oxidoreductase [Novosphingobium organovorum]